MMTTTVRRMLVLALGAAAGLGALAGVAAAQTDGSPQAPTQVQVLRGVGAPVADPTLGESTLLAPPYGALGSAG